MKREHIVMESEGQAPGARLLGARTDRRRTFAYCIQKQLLVSHFLCSGRVAVARVEELLTCGSLRKA